MNKLTLFLYTSRVQLKVVILFVLISGFSMGKLSAEASDNGIKGINQQEEITVSGYITSSEDNSPVPGVNVYLKGTTRGTITDIDGHYLIAVPSKESVLVFSCISYLSEEIVVGGQTEINIKMVPDITSLEQIVVVGYGVQKKATLTGSIEVIDAGVFEDRAVTSPALALQGQTPGLVVTRTSSRPGNEGIDFQIRGATSVNGGEPLIVVDGSPVINNEAFYNMNPDDIESISILKDGSAAIYGSRAANGVILVSTKKGEGKMKVELTSNFRVNTIGIRPPAPTMQEYAKIWLDATEQDGDQANYWGWMNRENLEEMQTGYEGIYTTQYWGDIFIGNYPRFEEMYGPSISNQQNLSISGASDKSSYRLSGGFSEDVGMLKSAYDGKQQYNLRFNYNYDITDWFKLQTGVSYFKAHVSSPSTGLDFTSMSMDPPFFPAKNPYGQWYANFGIAGNRNSTAATQDGGRENKYRDQVKLNFAATIDLLKDLSLQTTASIDKEFYDRLKYVLVVPQYTWFGELAPESVNSNVGSSIENERNHVTYQNYSSYLNYKKTFGGHEFSAMAGLNAELYEYTNQEAYRKGFEDNGIYDLNLGSTEESVTNSGGSGHWGLYSYLGRFNYAYKDKYLIELIGRRDGSSKFAEGFKWSNFGYGSAGWIISEEGFMKSVEMISFLKLRASYGETGNQVGIGNYDYLSTMGYGTTVFGNPSSLYNTAWVSGLTSTTRTWERVGIATYGVDFRLFEGKVFGSFDYFSKLNKGMLISINYPDILGGTAPKSNSGELGTKGWEVVLGYKNRMNEFQYNVSVNIGDSRNELVKMEGVSQYVAGKNSTVQGYPLNSWFMYKTDGLFQSEGEVTDYYNANSDGGQVPDGNNLDLRLRPGDVRRVDLDNSGSIVNTGTIDEMDGDVKYMGDAAPHYNFGINLGGKYRNFDFTAFFQGVLQQKIERSGYLAYPFVTIYTNQTPAYLGKTWTEENTGAEYPRMTNNTTRSSWNWAHNDFSLINNRYIRLKSLVVGYSFSEVKLVKYNIEKIRIYFSGNDLFEFSSIKDGYDPEYGESTQTSYPFNRTWSMGLNVTF